MVKNIFIDFIKYRKIAAILSFIMLSGSLILFAAQGLNLGIDFKGGILLEVKTKDGQNNIQDIRNFLQQSYSGDVSLQKFGADDIILIRLERKNENATQDTVAHIKAILEPFILEFRRTETVGPVVGDELKEAAFYAITFALIAMLIYIWFRFEWQFGVGAVIAIIHDVLLTVGLFAILQLEFNLATVAAVLTIAGYSINDTVVIYDRVRENMRKHNHKTLIDIFNISLNQTLSRTLLTSLTTLLAVLALVFLGGAVIRDFSIALLWGVIIGTYSSIYIAVPFLLFLQPNLDSFTDDETEDKGQ